MRVDFVKSIAQVMQEDEKALFLTGDLGYNALEAMAQSTPKRFINAGVAEQNMVGVAAGLAMTGFRPWVYSIAPFATYRCLEQIRNDVCLHGLTVRIVGNGGGYTYGIMGSTHHTLEDMSVLKALPGMSLFFPGTNGQVGSAVAAIQAHSGPAYLRLSISGFASNDAPLSENSKTLTRHYARGSALTVVGIGHAVQPVLAAKKLEGCPDIDVFGVARFPFDLLEDGALIESIQRTGQVLVVEEHYAPGSIAESLKLALSGTARFELACAKYSAGQAYGSSAFHLRQCGLAPEQLLARMHEMTTSK